ncbi:MAG: DUF790 family protein [Thermomicrobiales bacterium]
MAFRRQDIPKTTRKGTDGERRRLYPRYLRDGSVLPKIDLATAYLDGMVGRRRAELSPDAVVELFGDPKLARCILSCLADTYRYRTPAIREIAGEDVATRLAAWDLLTSADLRHHVYTALQRDERGCARPDGRADFLLKVAEPLGVDGVLLDRLLHLDAERNALLARTGERPEAEDVVARYNAMLTLSVLRQASSITLHLPRLDGTMLETICARLDVEWQRTPDGGVRLVGRRDAHGTWSRFGGRLARCAVQLFIVCPGEPEGEATVHLNSEPLRFVLDRNVVASVRPKQRASAGAAGTIRATQLFDDLLAYRRRWSIDGWTFRRAMEPLVVKGSLVLPEMLCVRGDLTVAVVAVEQGQVEAIAAIEAVDQQRPVIALGLQPGTTTCPAIATGSAEALLRLLETEVDEAEPGQTPMRLVAAELAFDGWVGVTRLDELFQGEDEMRIRLMPLTEDGEAAFVPGFGLCRTMLLDDLRDQHLCGPVEIPYLRAAIADRFGDGPAADALTLHLLSAGAFVPGRQARGEPTEARAA